MRVVKILLLVGAFLLTTGLIWWVVRPARRGVEENMPIHPSVLRLMTILPKPAKPVHGGDQASWQKTELELGVRFPDDYKSFIDVYGDGVIDKEILLINPFSPSVEDFPPYNYAFHLLSFQQRYANVRKWVPEFKDPIWPEEDGLLPLGSTGFGNEFAWRTKGPPNSWTILVFEARSHEYRELEMGIVEFLYSFLSGELATSQPPYKPKPPFRFRSPGQTPPGE